MTLTASPTKLLPIKIIALVVAVSLLFAQSSSAATPNCASFNAGTTILNDEFNGSNIALNENGTGGGFMAEYTSPASTAESGDNVLLAPINADFASAALRSYDNFNAKGANVVRTIVQLGAVQVSQDEQTSITYGMPGMPGTTGMDYRYQIGLVSANFPMVQTSPWVAELYKMGYQRVQDKDALAYGGFYVTLNYERESSNTDLSVTATIDTVNLDHKMRTDQYGNAGISSVASLSFPGYDGQSPISVQILTNQDGWAVCFDHAVVINNGQLTGAWNDPLFGLYPLTKEFDQGSRVFVQGQNISSGRGAGSVQSVIVQEAAQLPTDCLGVVGGSAVFDSCGVCAGDGTSCLPEDCNGVHGGSAVIDACGVCNGNAVTCLSPPIATPTPVPTDCLGVANGSADRDRCGVCAGNGSTCGQCTVFNYVTASDRILTVAVQLKTAAKKASSGLFRFGGKSKRNKILVKNARLVVQTAQELIRAKLAQIPAQTMTCQDLTRCVVTDYSSVITAIQQDGKTLAAAAKKPMRALVNVIRPHHLPKPVRRLGKLVKNLNISLFSLSASLPKENATCW